MNPFDRQYSPADYYEASQMLSNADPGIPGEYYMGGTTNRMLHGQFSFPNVKFEKSGAEINTAIDNRLKQFTTMAETSKAVIAKICLAREIDVKEVLEAGNDHQRIESYSSKALSNVPQQTNAILRAMQEDLNTLRNEMATVTQAEETCDNLGRVKKNIQANRKFDLTYAELTEFGF